MTGRSAQPFSKQLASIVRSSEPSARRSAGAIYYATTDDALARRVCLAALELQAGKAGLWIPVGRIAEHLSIEVDAALDRATAYANLRYWLSVGSAPPRSVLPIQGRLI